MWTKPSEASDPAVLGPRVSTLEALASTAGNTRTTDTFKRLHTITAAMGSGVGLTFGGRTLVNFLGADGGCESLTPFTTSGTAPTLSTTQVKTGTNSIKISRSASGSSAYKDYTYPLDSAKQYILGCWVYIESLTSGNPQIVLRDVGTSTSRYTATANTGTVGSWQFIYVRVPTANTLVGTGFRLSIGDFASDTYTAYYDSIRLYELSTADAAALGTTLTTTSSPTIDEKLPYVDSVKHLTGPTVTKYGKNLLPPFTEWTLHANAVVTEPYKMTLNAAGGGQSTTYTFDVLPNTQYTLSLTKTGATGSIVFYIQKDANGATITSSSSTADVMNATIATSATTRKLTIEIAANFAGTYTFANPQLELGSAATAFEPRNDDYVFAPVTLASSVDGTVKDTLTYRDSVWYKAKRWEPNVVLDGSLTWAFNTDSVGFKSFRATTPSAYKNGSEVVTKYDGKLLLHVASLTAADQTYTDGVGAQVWVTIADTDTGFGETFTPSAAEIKAFFYGYKMNNGTFGTPYNGTGTKTWTLWNATSNTGSVTVTPTTLATGFTPYSLSYQLATTQTEAVTVEGSLSLHMGGNQLELGEGVIVREKVVPIVYGNSYQINSTNVPTSRLQKDVLKFIAVYKNGAKDNKWTFINNSSYGDYRATTQTSTIADYDPTAEYTVSYVAKDKYAMTAANVDVQGEYETTRALVQEQTNKRLADVETGVTINVNAIANLYKRMKALGG